MSASMRTWGAAVILESVAPGLHGQSWALTIDEDTPSCAWIGVEVSRMTAPVANSLGMAVLYGAISDRPEAGSPAANAGIEAGEVITTINGSPLGSPRDFATTIAVMAPGTIIYLRTYRNRQPMGISLTLGRGQCPKSQPSPQVSLARASPVAGGELPGWRRT
jgi:S1-C subfamily serine protease